LTFQKRSTIKTLSLDLLLVVLIENSQIPNLSFLSTYDKMIDLSTRDTCVISLSILLLPIGDHFYSYQKFAYVKIAKKTVEVTNSKIKEEREREEEGVTPARRRETQLP
jgi:hypothetical protein